jgi:hypothetical protein
MGDIADMMLDGTLCEGCGEFLDENPPGYPRRCIGCGGSNPISPRQALKRPLGTPLWTKTPKAERAAKHNRERRERARLAGKPFECSRCHRLFCTEGGLKQHSKDVHEKPRAVQP